MCAVTASTEKLESLYSGVSGWQARVSSRQARGGFSTLAGQYGRMGMGVSVNVDIFDFPQSTLLWHQRDVVR